MSFAFRWLPISLGVVICTLFIACKGQLPGVGSGSWLPEFVTKADGIHVADLPEGVRGKAVIRSILFEVPALHSRDTMCSLVRPHFPVALPNVCGKSWRLVSATPFRHGTAAGEFTPTFWFTNDQIFRRQTQFSAPPGTSYYLWVPATRTSAILFAGGILLILTGCLRFRTLRRTGLRLPPSVAVAVTLSMTGAVAVALLHGAGRISALVSGALLLGFMSLVPRLRIQRGRAGMMLAAVGFIAVQIVVQIISSHADALYRSEPRRLAKFAREEITPQGAILLLGSSYTVHGINPSTVESELRRRGVTARIIILAAGGMSPIERMVHLREALARSKFRPTAVLFEISAYYDHDPLRLFRQNCFTDRMIGMMDRVSARESLDWIWVGSSLTLGERLTASIDVLEHAFLRTMGAGFLHGSETYGSVVPEPPLVTPQRDAMSAMELGARMSSAIEGDGIASTADDEHSHWAAGFYAARIEELRRMGIDTFGFYAVPVLSYPERMYSISFCSQEQVHPCAPMADKEFLSTLNRPEHWFDATHLNGEGREMNSRRFAEWIHASEIPK